MERAYGLGGAILIHSLLLYSDVTGHPLGFGNKPYNPNPNNPYSNPFGCLYEHSARCGHKNLFSICCLHNRSCCVCMDTGAICRSDSHNGLIDAFCACNSPFIAPSQGVLSFFRVCESIFNRNDAVILGLETRIGSVCLHHFTSCGG